jgi:hypothetical protein
MTYCLAMTDEIFCDYTAVVTSETYSEQTIAIELLPRV